MKTISALGYIITISRNLSKFPTSQKARRKLAHEVEDTRERGRSEDILRSTIPHKIQRVKRARLLVQNAGLMEAKEWVEIAFLDDGHGEIS